MKATILLAVIVLAVTTAFVGAPTALASGVTAVGQHGPQAWEPAWMLLSGATLIAAASVVRRYVP
jgi:hypothetical protein